MFHSTKRWCSTVQKRWCSTIQTGDAAQYKQVMLHSANRWCSIVQRGDVPHDDILIFPCGVLQVPGGTECVIDDILLFPYTLTFMLGTLSSHMLMLWDCNLTEFGPGTNRWCPTAETGEFPQYNEVMFHSTKRWISTVQTGDVPPYKQVNFHSTNRWCSTV